MAKSTVNKGHCYLCGQQISKGAMGRHLIAKHLNAENEQRCALLKIEDEFSNYWLFVDMPVSSTLKTLDTFLRKVWLECCGHMSMFYPPKRYGSSIGMNKKVSTFEPGSTLMYDYDFGSTTTLKIQFVQETTRPAQRTAVRVLARNDPYVFSCSKCEQEAVFVDTESWPPDFYCKKHCRKRDVFGLLPVVNSPRMGVCAYTGELDSYAFSPEIVPQKQ